MKLPKFFIAENNQFEKGAVFIISTESPFYVGKVYRYKNKAEWKRRISETPKIVSCLVNDYMILIDLIGSLDLVFYINSNQKEKEENGIISGMADFFTNERITPNLSYFKRYALPGP